MSATKHTIEIEITLDQVAVFAQQHISDLFWPNSRFDRREEPESVGILRERVRASVINLLATEEMSDAITAAVALELPAAITAIATEEARRAAKRKVAKKVRGAVQ